MVIIPFGNGTAQSLNMVSKPARYIDSNFKNVTVQTIDIKKTA